MKIFLDANILFSASRKDSILRKFIQFLIEAGYTLCTNDYARTEAERNILAKKFVTEAEFTQFINSIPSSNILKAGHIPDLAEKDQPVMRGALGLECDYLLTSDRKDFGIFLEHGYQTLKVGTPSMLAEFLELGPVKE